MKGLYEVILEPRGDERGFLTELYRKDLFKKSGIEVDFVQDNQSRSQKNVIRGLHFQWDPPLGKLMRVSRGSLFFVAVDIRKKSETLGQRAIYELSEEGNLQIYASAGFACGFCVLSDTADLHYKYTAFYNPAGESNIIWNDPILGIPWPVKIPRLSERDKNAYTFNSWLKRPESDYV